MNRHDDLINQLSANLEPVRPRVNVNLLALGWFVLSAAYVVAMIHLFGPIRPNAYSQLASVPRFAMENALGLSAILLVGLAAFRGAVPGVLSRRFALTGAVVMLLWIINYLVGLYHPALEPSMMGKREHCFSETFIYAIPPAAAAFFLINRRYPLRPIQTALSLSIAAGMLPALYMQIACMYSPDHALSFHILPGLLVGAAGVAVALIARRFGLFSH